MCLLPYETASSLKEGTATPLLSELPTSGLARHQVYQTLATFTSVGEPTGNGQDSILSTHSTCEIYPIATFYQVSFCRNLQKQ